MKRLLALLFAVVSVVTLQAQTQDNAMYVYRNDGSFNAFLREDIDSITLSHFDLDSIRHQEPVCQVFHTPDSIYRIPIAAIDSVSFVAPQIVLKSDAILLEGELRASIIDVDKGKLIFSKDSEKFHRFRIGEKLVTWEMSDMFPAGFVGEIIEVGNANGNIYVICQDVDIEEVFYSYCYVINSASRKSAVRNEPAKYTNKQIDKTFALPTFSATWELAGSFDILPNTQFGGSASITSSLKPKLRIKGCDIVDPIRGRITDITIVGKYDVGLNYDCSVGVSARKEFSFFPFGKVPEALIGPFLSVFFDAGVFLEGSANISYSHSVNSNYIFIYNIKRIGNSLEHTKPVLKEVDRSDDDFQLALKGRVAGGLYCEVGIKPWLIDKDAMSKLSISADLGVELESTNGFDFEDLRQASVKTALYDAVNIADEAARPNVNIGAYVAFKFNARWTPFEFNLTMGKFAIGAPIYQGGLFPHFSDLRVVRNGKSNEINSTCTTSRLCPFSYKLGFTVFDSDGNKLKTEYYPTLYSRNPLLRFDEYNLNISGIESNKEYVIHPCIEVFGYDVLASPSKKFKMEGPLVEISDFTVTDSHYYKNGLDYKGRTYTYKYDTSVNFCLQETDMDIVEDWGYVYRDLEGNDEYISLKPFGTNYTDTRYAYYRNKPKSHVTLFGYVKYRDSDECVYDEPQMFDLQYEPTECNDENHPHMVDLGLPSGTKWSCCNVGAEASDEPGSFYSWAETTTKQDFTWGNYFDSPYDADGSWKGCNIMHDISSTEHDAATVALGEKWRMPTKDEMQELLDNCEWSWEENGYKVTGPNGNTIFLPAAGNADGGNINQAGSYGGYWTSTPNESESKATASNLYFYKATLKSIQWSNRYVGRSIRAVTSRD